MQNYLQSSFINEKKIRIGEIPALLFKPNKIQGRIPTIIFYHGWSSSKDSQKMRAFILANLGYQVIVPDAIYHGERNALEVYDGANAAKYFWDIVFKNMEEFGLILDEMVQNYDADLDRIAVMGHSMGGITAGGIFTHNNKINTLVVLNGSCSWEDSNDEFKQNLGLDIKALELEEKVRSLDPINNLDLLVNRPIILLHGEHDTIVPVSSQKLFYERLKKLDEGVGKLKMITYQNLNHFVTTEMMEESAIWLGEHLT